MATSKRTRVFMGLLAGLFLFTSSALTIAVVYQALHSNNASDTAAAQAQKQAQQQAQQQAKSQTKLPGFTPTSQPQTKLQTTDLKKGTGATVQAGDTITADYTGALMKTGVVFDASSEHGGPQSFSLSQVIAGWSQGIPGMKVGGTRQLLIPAGLAYGSQAQQGIPADSDLVFNVTVTKIDKK